MRGSSVRLGGLADGRCGEPGEAGADLAVGLDVRGVIRLQLDEFLVGVAGALELLGLHAGVGLEFEDLGDHGVFAGALEEA